MKKIFYSLPIAAGLVLSGCGGDNNGNEVISKRYIHKYGYAVSKAEWDANHFPGQVVTTMRDGVTITATYEDGQLHGPTTHTHPHSQTVQYYFLYHFGKLKKELVYNSLGMPVREKVQLSPHRECITMWYGDGTPMSMEDYTNEELLDGQYFSLNNEIESRVERGSGVRSRRDQHGSLLSKDYFDAGYLTKIEAFYPNGSPESTTHYVMNKREGTRVVFAPNGHYLAQEEWVNDKLHGKAIYFNNGYKQMEVYFVNGTRSGVETHFIDGEHIEQEIHWIRDRRHGPTNFFVSDAVAKTEWYYDGKMVSKKRFDELDAFDKMISQGPIDLNP